MASRPAVFSDGKHNISGGNFMSADNIHVNQHLTTNDKGLKSIAFTELRSYAVPAALHNSGETSDPPKCHPGTRVALINLLMAWAFATIYEYPIRWLNGPAGAGKSAIMRSLAELLVENGLLLASFFFFKSDPRRNNAARLISTVAYQLYITVPPIQPWIEHGIESNPLIFNASLLSQIHTLVLNPLLRYFYDPQSTIITPFPRIILIDGLDECSGDETQQEILHMLCKMVQTLPIPIAIVVASRPEHQIRSAFELGNLNEASSRLTLDKSFEPDADIWRYYDSEFDKIRRTHPVRRHLATPWPSQEVIRTLVRNASGQFVYAATVIKFVKSTRHNPAARLQIVLGEADQGRSRPFEQLDILYTLVFLDVDPEILPDTLRLLGVILTPPRNGQPVHQSPKFMELLLGFPAGHVQTLLLDLESLLTVGDDEDAIRVHHTSLSDFLFNKYRAGDFFIDKGLVYSDVGSSCIAFFREPQVMVWHTHLGSYIQGQLLISLQKATPTDQLRRLIVSCDMEALIDLPESTSPNALTFLFLIGLKESAYPDVEIFYKTQLHPVRSIINFKLLEHWLAGQRFYSSPLFVLALALTPACPREAKDLISYATGFYDGFHSVSVLPGIVSPGYGDPNDMILTAGAWHSLARIILEVICSPTGLLHDERSELLRTDLTLSLVLHVCQELESQKNQFLDHLKKILPILLPVSLPRHDLISAVQQAQRAMLRRGTGERPSASNSEDAELATVFDSYIQRTKSNRKRSDHSKRNVFRRIFDWKRR